jgi:hypothetical protein
VGIDHQNTAALGSNPTVDTDERLRTSVLLACLDKGHAVGNSVSQVNFNSKTS